MIHELLSKFFTCCYFGNYFSDHFLRIFGKTIGQLNMSEKSNNQVNLTQVIEVFRRSKSLVKVTTLTLLVSCQNSEQKSISFYPKLNCFFLRESDARNSTKSGTRSGAKSGARSGQNQHI